LSNSHARKKFAYHSRSTLGERTAIALSRQVHLEEGESEEKYKEEMSEGNLVKSFVFGGLDGCITAFAVVSSASGASLSPGTTLVLGLANVFADGLAMGCGDYISERAEREYIRSEYEREKWELEHYPEGEVKEMRDIYTERFGVEDSDADTMLNLLLKYKPLFLETMAHFELGLLPPDSDNTVWRKGFTTFLSFITFGCAPLSAYILFWHLRSPQEIFFLSILATAATLFALGFLKARLVKQHGVIGGLQILFTGAFAASVAYFVGFVAQQLLRFSEKKIDQ